MAEYSLLAPEAELTHHEAMDLVYAATEAVVEFMREYSGKDSERLSNALRTALELLYKTQARESDD